MPRVRARLAVPRTDQVTVSPERNERLWPRLHAEAGGESQVAARRATRDADPLRICMEKLRSLLANPAECILHVLDNLLQLRFRRQAIIDGDEHVFIFAAPVGQPSRHALAVPID